MSQHSVSTAVSYRLKFPQLDREIATRENETIFQSARRHGVRIVGACGGRGTCGSCVLQIGAGEVAHIQTHGDAADKAAPIDSYGRKWLRACQIHACSDCTIEVAPRSLAPVVRTDTDRGEKEILALDSVVVANDINLPEATLHDNLADSDRVLRALGAGNQRIDLAAARELPGILRTEGNGATWPLRVWSHDNEIIGFGSIGQRSLGLAIDLGTTNVAGFLIDLDTGERLASLGIENPQVAWGADLISRLNHSIHGTAAVELRTGAVTAINALAHDLCHSVGLATTGILDVVICGNTAMHHLLLELPVRQLGRAPFIAAVRNATDIKARELGLTVAPGAAMHIVPNIGGFVGGDHVAALLATEHQWRDIATALVMDIGTNTEITLMHGGHFYSASAPSGPALEGGNISCGMRAAEGAIEKVAYVDGCIVVKTIGHKKAVGLCGSGVLDTLAALHRAGLINDHGRLAAKHPDIVHHANKRAVQLAPDVLFTQDDVRAVQLAKAAIRTAIDLLLDTAGIAETNIQSFIIAGSFGAYIDLASGIDIGLFPSLARERYLQVGNAAGVGVRRMLASRRDRQRAQELAKTCHYMELSSRGDFQKVFLQRIGFNNTKEINRE